MNDSQNTKATGRRTNKLRRRLTFVLVEFLMLFSLAYFGWIAYRSWHLYSALKSHQRGWEGKVHRADDHLGFVPIPGSRGKHIFPIGNPIPMGYDKHGFRKPLSARHQPNLTGPTILTLGGSFTYGDACYAIETYPYQLAKSLDGIALNAGVCSYGLVQMQILARRLIPKHRPDYVIAQYSPWLVSRAGRHFAPTYFGMRPVPFLVRHPNGEIAHHPPVFLPILFELNIGKHRQTSAGIKSYLQVLFGVGFPLFVHDDFHAGLYYTKRNIGTIPAPMQDRNEIVNYIYRDIANVVADNASQLLVVLLGDAKRNYPPEELAVLHKIPGVIVVDAAQALIQNLADNTRDAYLRAYAHLRGSPPEMVDPHPNGTAHRIIADELAKAIRKL